MRISDWSSDVCSSDLLRLDALRVFARWITPPIMPKRFDTFFYVVHAPANQVAACDGHETVDAEWIAPRDVLRLAGSGERTVIFRSEEHTSELQSLMRISYAVFCLKTKKKI